MADPSFAPPSRIVVAGASLAGLSAAEALRRLGYFGDLVLVGDEPHPPYDRPPLSKQAQPLAYNTATPSPAPRQAPVAQIPRARGHAANRLQGSGADRPQRPNSRTAPIAENFTQFDCDRSIGIPIMSPRPLPLEHGKMRRC
jgi:hypothetical protein